MSCDPCERRPFLYRRMACYRDTRFRDEIAVVWATDREDAMRLLSAEFEYPRESLLSEIDPHVPVTIVSR